MRRTLSSLLLLVVSLAAHSAHAQPQPRGARPEPAPANPAAIPVAPEVNDPMLTPPPRAKTEVATWDDALKLVRARSTDLRIAVKQVAVAEAQSRIALAAALPTLQGDATYEHNLITNKSLQPAEGGGFKTYTAPYPDQLGGALTAKMPVIAFQPWYAIGTADRNEDVARLSVQDAKRTIALAVANAIVGAVTAERLAELNRVGLKNALLRLELANRRSTLGSGTGLDVVRAKQDVETARATLVTGDESLRQAREALGLALGLPEQVGVPPNVDLNGLESSTRASCKPAQSIDERPDIAALQGTKDVAHRKYNEVKLQFLPTVSLGSQVGSTTVDTGALPNTTWNITAVLTVPIFDGGVKYGNLRNTSAQEAIAGEKLEAARRKATIEVVQAQRGVSVAESSRKVAADSRDLAAENDRLTRTAYLEGRGTSLELVTAAQGLRQTELQLAVRDFELVKARVLAVLAKASCDW